jgi:hypothetical protein
LIESRARFLEFDGYVLLLLLQLRDFRAASSSPSRRTLRARDIVHGHSYRAGDLLQE